MLDNNLFTLLHAGGGWIKIALRHVWSNVNVHDQTKKSHGNVYLATEQTDKTMETDMPYY